MYHVDASKHKFKIKIKRSEVFAPASHQTHTDGGRLQLTAAENSLHMANAERRRDSSLLSPSLYLFLILPSFLSTRLCVWPGQSTSCPRRHSSTSSNTRWRQSYLFPEAILSSRSYLFVEAVLARLASFTARCLLPPLRTNRDTFWAHGESAQGTKPWRKAALPAMQSKLPSTRGCLLSPSQATRPR